MTGWILEIPYLHTKAVLGRSRSNGTITPLTAALAPQRPCLTDQGLERDSSAPCPLTRGIARLGGPWDPILRRQQGRLSTARLGEPQALNNGTERGSLFLLRKRTIINFIARPCAGGFPRFPKKLFLLSVSNNQTAAGAAAGAGAGTGSSLGAGDAARACVRSPVKALRSSPLEASQLCQPCLSLHQSCQLG